MSPLFVGAANSTNKFLGNLSSDPGSGNAEGNFYYNSTEKKYYYYDGTTWTPINKPGPGESSSTAIETDVQAQLWASSNANPGFPWVKISGVDGGNGSGAAFQVYSEYTNSKLFCLAARFAGGDNNASNSGASKIRWSSCRNPNLTSSGNQNDWGSGTHVFNNTLDFSTGSDATSTNKSARTALWNHSTSKTLFQFKNMDQSGSGDLVYDMSNTESWSTRMKTRGYGGGTDYYQNDTAVRTGSVLASSVSQGTKEGANMNNIYAGTTDGEAANADTNDACMLWFDNDTGFVDGTGAGWKRSGADPQWPRNGGSGGTTPTFDTSNNNSDSGSNHYGIVCQNSENGNMKNVSNGVITMLVEVF
tara:strand:+ start:71 stop:1153 length:1083 start_codon:yes stop_codon:yes gene_type:complete